MNDVHLANTIGIIPGGLQTKMCGLLHTKLTNTSLTGSCNQSYPSSIEWHKGGLTYSAPLHAQPPVSYILEFLHAFGLYSEKSKHTHTHYIYLKHIKKKNHILIKFILLHEAMITIFHKRAHNSTTKDNKLHLQMQNIMPTEACKTRRSAA